MADIHIVQDHDLTPIKARAAAEQVADKLTREFGLACRWDGDVLRFERSGVDGTLTLAERQARLEIKLGFLFASFASSIESNIVEKMRKVFAA